MMIRPTPAVMQGGRGSRCILTPPRPKAIPAGRLESFALAISDDAVAEANETVSLSIIEANGATPGSLTSHTHTIRNDDTPLVP